MKLSIIFIILNIINVVMQTVKSLATVKCGKGVAAIVNAIAFGLYTVVLVYMTCDLSTMSKALIVAICNLVGVYIVKSIEEKIKKDKLWLVKMTIPTRYFEEAKISLTEKNISFTVLPTTSNYYVFDCFCNTQEDTSKVLETSKRFEGKTFATENKLF